VEVLVKMVMNEGDCLLRCYTV